MALVLTQRALIDGPIHLTDVETGEHIEITTVQADRGQARLSIKASDNIEIQRDVIYQKIQREKENESR